MISVCIYCGQNKSKALDRCGGCSKTPDSHADEIHSIIMCFSEEEPYLNFISMDELEALRASIVNGSAINIKQETFRQAEEAYNAVGLLDRPQTLSYFARISHPVMVVVLFLFIAFVLMGA